MTAIEIPFNLVASGLQGSLTDLGTAQSVVTLVARKAAQDFVGAVRTELVSLAAKSTVNAQFEPTERFLSGVSADALWAHTQIGAGLASVLSRPDESVAVGKVPPSAARFSSSPRTSETSLSPE